MLLVAGLLLAKPVAAQDAVPAPPPPAAVEAPKIKVQLTRQAVREKARVQIESGQADQAIKNLSAILAKFPDDQEAFYLLGRAYEAKLDLKTAIANYAKATTVKEAYAAQARIYREKLQDAELASRTVAVGLNKFPDYIPLLIERAIQLINRDQFAAAEKVLRRAVQLPTGDSIPNRFYLAQSLHGQKKYAEARPIFKELSEQTRRKSYARAAKDYLENIDFEESRMLAEQQAKAKTAQPVSSAKPFSFLFRLKGDYDTNVALYPDSEKVNLPGGSSDDFRLAVEMAGSYRFPETKYGAFGFSANVYSGTLFRLTDFQAGAVGAGAFVVSRGEGEDGVGDWLWKNSLDASYGFFGHYGGDPDPNDPSNRSFSLFSQTYALNSRAIYRFAEFWNLNGSLQPSYTKFGSDSAARNNFTTALSVGPSRTIGSGPGSLRIDLLGNVKYRTAKSDDYSLIAYGVTLNVQYRLVKEIDLTAGAIFDRRDHFNSDAGGDGNYSTKRVDNNLIWYAGTEWTMGEWANLKGKLSLLYSGENNSSTNTKASGTDLEYSKHVISLGFGVEY